MWESFSSILNGNNAVVVLITVFLIFMITVIMTKKGMFRLCIKGLNIGNAEKERNILRQQTLWAKAYCDSLQSKMPEIPNYNEYITKYTLERMYDEIVNWIMFNHISVSKSYINVKQSMIISLVDSIVINDAYRSESFHQFLKDETEYVIKQLMYIREAYS